MTLTPKKAFALTKLVQLAVDGEPPSGLQDAEGRLIDGDHNGNAGGNAIAILSRSGANISALADDATDVARRLSDPGTSTWSGMGSFRRETSGLRPATGIKVP